MRRPAIAVALAIAVSTAALAGAPSDEAVELLSGIDFVPSRFELAAALGPEPAAELAELVADPATDAGVRLRALRALAIHPGAIAEDALAAAAARYAGASDGTEILLLRASVDGFAQVAGAAAAEPLAPLLDHPSRDVRATVASALATAGAVDAIGALRARLQVEPVEQVRLALSAAIRALGNG